LHVEDLFYSDPTLIRSVNMIQLLTQVQVGSDVAINISYEILNNNLNPIL